MHIRIFFILMIGSVAVYSQEDTRLKEAFNTRSKEKLAEFYKQWVSETPPLTEAAIDALKPSWREAYRVFGVFYDSALRESASGKPYRVVQGVLPLGIVSSLDLDSIVMQDARKSYRGDTALINKVLKKRNGRYKHGTLAQHLRVNNPHIIDTIDAFRPAIANAAFVNEKYAALLNAFAYEVLTLPEPKKRADGFTVLPIDNRRAIRDARMNFLEEMATLSDHHGAWTIQPRAEYIVFDKHFHNALIPWRTAYSGGYAFLYKEKGKWKIMEMAITWSE